MRDSAFELIECRVRQIAVARSASGLPWPCVSEGQRRKRNKDDD